MGRIEWPTSAGLLVNSMAAANQEISAELQALAMKDPRFKKGQTRAKGGGAPPGGGKRRVRKRCLLTVQSGTRDAQRDQVKMMEPSWRVWPARQNFASCSNKLEEQASDLDPPPLVTIL